SFDLAKHIEGSVARAFIFQNSGEPDPDAPLTGTPPPIIPGGSGARGLARVGGGRAPVRTPWGGRNPATGRFMSGRQVWQQEVSDLRGEILELEEALQGIERPGRNFGYGPHRTTGTESTLRQKYKELADLIAAEPK